MMDDGMMDDGMMDGGMWAVMGIWWFFLIALLLAVLVLAVLGSISLVRRLRQDGAGSKVGRHGSAESAHDTLRRRYAAGEIGDDEYERRLSTLNRQ
jgi:putative membrane protein